MQPLDFYFDFSSPYGYVASCRIDEIAARHGRKTTWRPYLMGAAFKRTGRAPLVEYDLVGNYARRDIERSARQHGIPIGIPSKFPVPTISAGRVFYFLADGDGPNAQTDAKAFAQAIYHGYFADDRPIQDKATVVSIAVECGHDEALVLQAMNDPAVKDRLRAVTDDAIDAGVFGSPYIIVDGEPFWGADRLDQIDQWLATGGW